MDTVRAWKDPEYRKSFEASSLPAHPAGIVALDEARLDMIAGGTTVVCATITLTVTVCSPTGTACGSCGMGTVGCC